jgi:hypothetical protein
MSDFQWLPIRHHHNLLAIPNSSTLYLAIDKHALIPKLIQYRYPQRGILISLRQRRLIQQLQQSRPVVPSALRGLRLLDVLPREPRDRHIPHICSHIEPTGILQKGVQLAPNESEPVLAPVILIHLVDNHHQLLHPQRPGQHAMLLGLAPPVEATFELSHFAAHHQGRYVCLGCPLDHVRHVVFVAWRVQDGEPF